jgi:hypothetical protein
MAVNSLGYEMWKFDANAQITNPSVVVDLEGDNYLEVLVLTNSGNIICLDGESVRNYGILICQQKLSGEQQVSLPQIF